MNNRRPGFTIVELLIVIVVIAILAAITIVAYSGLQQRARDSQRQSELSTIQKVLELYKANNGAYPACGGGAYIANNGTASVCSISSLTDLQSPQYLGKTLNDPTNSGNYQYKYAAGFRNTTNTCGVYDQSQNYIIGARFETNSGNVAQYNCWSLDLNYKAGSNN